MDLNRYPDILPSMRWTEFVLFIRFLTEWLLVEHTRVRLNPSDGSGRGDYINANFLSSGLLGDSPEYISTQGPLRDTVVDFWRMVLQTRSAAILMATPLNEGGRVGVASLFCAPHGLLFCFWFWGSETETL
jgi:hypothetical protein